MPTFPSNWTRVTLVWNVIDILGGNANGTLTLTAKPIDFTDINASPSALTILPIDIVGQITNGAMTLPNVPVTNDPDVSPLNFTYHFKAEFKQPNGVKLEWDSPIPAELAPTVDVTTLVQTEASGGTQIVIGGGGAGAYTLNGDPGPDFLLNSTDLLDIPGSVSPPIDPWTWGAQQAASAQSAAISAAQGLLTGVSAGGFKGTKTIPSSPYHLLNGDNGYLLEWLQPGTCTIIVDPDSTGHYDGGFSCGAVQGAGAGVVSWQGATAPSIIVRGTNFATYNEAQANVFNPQITMPAGIQNGDWVITSVGTQGGRSFTPLPSGTGYAFAEITPATGITGGGANNHLFEVINAPSSLSSQVITFPISSIVGVPVVLAVIVLGNVDTTNPVDNHAVSGSSSTKQTPTLSPLTANSGWLSFCCATNGATNYGTAPAHPFTMGTVPGVTLTKAVDIGTSTAGGANAAVAIGYAGASGTLTQFQTTATLGGDTWSVNGIASTRTISVKPLPATGGVILPTDNNSTRTPGSMITLVRSGADRWYAGGPT